MVREGCAYDTAVALLVCEYQVIWQLCASPPPLSCIDLRKQHQPFAHLLSRPPPLASNPLPSRVEIVPSAIHVLLDLSVKVFKFAADGNHFDPLFFGCKRVYVDFFNPGCGACGDKIVHSVFVRPQ